MKTTILCNDIIINYINMKKRTLTIIGAMLLAMLMPVTNATAQNLFQKLKTTAEKIEKGVSELNGSKSKESKTVGSSSTELLASANPSTKGKVSSKSDVEGISVKVKKCFRDENDNVTLIFTLLNESGSKAVCQLRAGNSVAYDDEGNVYKDDRIRFSSMDGGFQENWDADLPKDIAVKYRMRIKDVDDDAAVLKQVSIYMYELPIGTKNGRVHLYNVPISRPGD